MHNYCATVTDDDRSTSVRLDPTAIRVLAHPLRSRLLGTLRLHGPATATALAATLETNTGATSYHLRKLADVGLVEETGEGRGRERWWRSVHRQHSFSVSDYDDPDSRAAASWLEQHGVRLHQRWIEDWLRSADDLPPQWRGAGDLSDYHLDLTAEQLRALSAELSAVVDRYRDAGPADGEDDPRRVIVLLQAFPQAGDAL